jgi:hypothetical protein
MKTIEAGTRVTKGYYFSAKSWMLTPVANDGELLPGAGGEKFLRIPLLVAFAVAPMMGALFLMFLPLIGFYLTARAVARPVVGAFRKSATEVAATVAPVWVPGEAHLAGEPAKKEGETAEPAQDTKLDDLAKEIEQKRQ